MLAPLTSQQRPLVSATVRRFTIGVVVLVAALAAAIPAQAAGTGRYIPGLVTCTGRITVTPPVMYATADVLLDSTTGQVIEFQPGQWVAFRPHLTKLIGSQWVRVQSGPWHARIQYSMHESSPGASWLNRTTNTEGNGWTSFAYNGMGRYRVYVEYHWYPIRPGLPSGTLSVWAPWYASEYTPWFFDMVANTDGYCRMG